QQQQQQQQPPFLLNNQRKYKSVFEPGLDYYKSSPDNLLPEKTENDETSQTNEEEVQDVVLRPKKPQMMTAHVNALLIDELKKRQSNFYESREPHYPPHHNLINSLASVQ
ncbi:hypothetical protein BLA29_005657, partial [Euroglyphus maynei]